MTEYCVTHGKSVPPNCCGYYFLSASCYDLSVSKKSAKRELRPCTSVNCGSNYSLSFQSLSLTKLAIIFPHIYLNKSFLYNSPDTVLKSSMQSLVSFDLFKIQLSPKLKNVPLCPTVTLPEGAFTIFDAYRRPRP